MTKHKANIAKTAFGFVVIIGIVNLFPNITYEGARSITGPFPGSRGASATVVGVVAGAGDLLGYTMHSAEARPCLCVTIRYRDICPWGVATLSLLLWLQE
jgi:hypothetical protein